MQHKYLCMDAVRGKDAPPPSKVKMAASSVTGTGPGESGGLQKPQHHSGCGCGSSTTVIPAKKPEKRGCFIKSRSGGVLRHGSSSGFTSEKSCF